MPYLNVDWQEFALCSRVDPELFHPTKGGPQIRPARVVCGQCEVRLSCINHAIQKRITEGVWGGYSGQQLRALVRCGETLDTLPEPTKRGNLTLRK